LPLYQGLIDPQLQGDATVSLQEMIGAAASTRKEIEERIYRSLVESAFNPGYRARRRLLSVPPPKKTKRRTTAKTKS
jgi:hypothetical protein